MTKRRLDQRDGHDGFTELVSDRDAERTAPAAPHPNRHGSGGVRGADRHGLEFQRVLRPQPPRRLEARDAHAIRPHKPIHHQSSRRQPHPRPRPQAYQPIKRRNSSTMVGKVSERVLAREGEYFRPHSAMRPWGLECATTDTVPTIQASRERTMA